MKTILFINLSQEQIIDEFRSFMRDIKRKPLLNFQILTGCLLDRFNENISVQIIDNSVLKKNDKFLIELILAEDPLLIGLYVNESLKDDVVRFVKLIRDKDKKFNIIVGGPGWTHYEFFLKNGIDAVCLGEGDVFIVD